MSVCISDKVVSFEEDKNSCQIRREIKEREMEREREEQRRQYINLGPSSHQEISFKHGFNPRNPAQRIRYTSPVSAVPEVEKRGTVTSLPKPHSPHSIAALV